jgi:hypothetical protein
MRVMKISFFYGFTVKSLMLFLPLFSFAFVSCNQDPIFYNISNEVAPIPPRIEGLTTDIVELGGSLYVASMGSGNIHQYADDTKGWDTAPPTNPGGTIRGLAATSTHLYALTFGGIDPSGSKLMKKSADALSADVEWTMVAEISYMQKVYAAGDRVFVWAGTNPNAGTFYYEDNDTLKIIPKSIGMLNGAVKRGDGYFLACSDGIYTYTLGGTPEKVTDGTITIMGIINVENRIVAAGRNSLYYNANDSPDNFISTSLGFICTGAMGLWKDTGGNNALLLLGVQNLSSSNTEHGYREIILNKGELDIGNLTARQPGQAAPSSISNYGQYHSSIGTHPVVAIRQFSPAGTDGNGILFAGTSRDGLWSYRDRGDGIQWNAEN